jgi:uncharacterized protein YkwD
VLALGLGVSTTHDRTGTSAGRFEVLSIAAPASPDHLISAGAHEPPKAADRPALIAPPAEAASDTFDPAEPPAADDPAEPSDGHDGTTEDQTAHAEPSDDDGAVASEATPEPQPTPSPPPEQKAETPPPPASSEDEEPEAPAPAPKVTAQPGAADTTFSLIQDTRSQAGVAPLQRHAGADSVAQAWAEKMAADGSLQHNPDFASQLWNAVGSGTVAENIGQISPADPAAMHQRFLASPNHHANIIGSFTYVGIGAAKDADGMLWVVHNFVEPN